MVRFIQVRFTAPLPLLIVILLLGLALRLYRLDALPLRGDEGFSAQYWAGQPLLTTLQTTATIEPHPPLTYAVFRVWGVLFGTHSELLLRLLPVLGNLIGIAALYALGRRLHSRTAGLLAAFLWAINPYQIWHAQDFRNYALWSSTSLIALWLAVRVMQRRRTSDWVLYVGAMLISSLIFYFDLLTMGAVGGFVLITYRREWRFVLRWIMVNAGIFVTVAILFALFQGALIGSGAYAGTTARADLVQLITVFIPTIVFGDTMPASVMALLGVFAFVAFAGGLWIMGSADTATQQQADTSGRLPTALFLACVGALPLAALYGAALRFGIFTPRYVMIAAPAWVLMGAIVIARTWRAETKSPLAMAVQRIMGAGILIGWMALNVSTLNNYYHDPLYHKTRDWRALAGYLAQNVSADDLVIQTAVDAGFGYYYDVSGSAALDIGLPDNFDQPADEIRSVLVERVTQHDSLWVVARTFSDWPNAGVVESWVQENLQLVRQTVIDDLPVRQYKPWQVAANEISAVPLTTFGPYVTLAQAAVFTPPEPTGELTLWLYWQPIQLTPRPYKVFVHLIGAANPATGSPLWAQSDYPPQQGRVQTNSWTVGTLYRDVYTLTVRDVPPGEYQIVVGLYDPVTNERVLSAEGRDHAAIGTVTLP